MNDDCQNGFVLPYVLLVIAILSFVVTLVAQRIQNSAQIISRIEGRFGAELALTSAESELTYAILTAVPVDGGMELNPSDQLEIITGRITKDRATDVWSAAGGERISKTSNGNVLVIYRDVMGFVPLNSADIDLTERLLKSLGATPDQAKGLAAKLVDYVDGDNRRRFRGGERSEYRLRNRPLPSNGPIRQYAELNSILDWDEFFKYADLQMLMEVATLNNSTVGMRQIFTPAKLQQDLGIDISPNNSIKNALSLGNFPANVGRFVLQVNTTEGETLERAVEIEKKLGNLYRPFRRFFVYDLIKVNGANQALARENGIKNVIHAEAYRSK